MQHDMFVTFADQGKIEMQQNDGERRLMIIYFRTLLRWLFLVTTSIKEKGFLANTSRDKKVNAFYFS